MKQLLLLLTITLVSQQVIADNYPTDDRESADFIGLSRLSCISDGIKAKTNLRPSDRYLSLLAAIAYQNAQLPSSQNSSDNDIRINRDLELSLQKRIIENIQLFGFCLDKKLDETGNVTSESGYSNILSNPDENIDEIRAMFIANDKSSKNQKNKVASKYFGFESFSEASNVFYNPDWLNKKTPSERQKYFREKLELALSAQEKQSTFFDESSFLSQSSSVFTNKDLGKGAKECLQQLKKMTDPNTSTLFSLKDNNLRKDNIDLCKSMANSCQFPSNSFCSGEEKTVQVQPVVKKEIKQTQPSKPVNMLEMLGSKDNQGESKENKTPETKAPATTNESSPKKGAIELPR